MPHFKVHVVLTVGLDVVQFAPGDEVPDWALEFVGDHCFADAVEPDVVSDEPFMRPADDSAEPAPEPAATAAPDFTGAAKPRATRAPRKKA